MALLRAIFGLVFFIVFFVVDFAINNILSTILIFFLALHTIFRGIPKQVVNSSKLARIWKSIKNIIIGSVIFIFALSMEHFRVDKHFTSHTKEFIEGKVIYSEKNLSKCTFSSGGGKRLKRVTRSVECWSVLFVFEDGTTYENKREQVEWLRGEKVYKLYPNYNNGMETHWLTRFLWKLPYSKMFFSRLHYASYHKEKFDLPDLRDKYFEDFPGLTFPFMMLGLSFLFFGVRWLTLLFIKEENETPAYMTSGKRFD